MTDQTGTNVTTSTYNDIGWQLTTKDQLGDTTANTYDAGSHAQAVGTAPSSATGRTARLALCSADNTPSQECLTYHGNNCSRMREGGE